MRIWRNPSTNDIAADLVDFLKQLNGPCAIQITGADTSRCRAIVTLQHGNEISGVRALHQLLREGFTAATSLLIVIANPAAALHEPLFSHRSRPGHRDQNRCFRPPFGDEEGQTAQDIIKLLHQLQPEALIDVHNTTGSSDGFAVAWRRNEAVERIAARFVPRLIMSSIALGALMELEVDFPIVTIECGGIQQAESDQLALNGLRDFIEVNNVLEPVNGPLRLYEGAHRVELKNGTRLVYGGKQTDADITLFDDIDQHNFATLTQDVAIGWLGAKGLDVLHVSDPSGRNRVEDFFVECDGLLCVKRPLDLFMITTTPSIALSDCMMYFVERTQVIAQ